MGKIIIVEGIDNCGKDYVCDRINYLIKKNNDCAVNYDWHTSVINIHCLKPVFNDKVSKSSMKMELEAGERYSEMMTRASETCFSSSCSYIIMNRSFLGEAVYGPMYRNVEKQHADMMLTMVEAAVRNKLHAMFPEWHSAGAFMRDNIICVNCSCPAEWALKNEDGKSQSMRDVNRVREELRRFRDVANNAGWMTVVNFSTVKSDGGCARWKTDDEIDSELGAALF